MTRENRRYGPGWVGIGSLLFWVGAVALIMWMGR